MSEERDKKKAKIIGWNEDDSPIFEEETKERAEDPEKRDDGLENESYFCPGVPGPFGPQEAV